MIRLQEPAFLLFDVGDRTCALPVEHVREVMRPLAVEPIGDAPTFVIGASIVRGAPTPILDAGALLNGRGLRDPARWISVKVGDGRSVCLQVSRVLGIYPATSIELSEASPLLQGAETGLLESLGRRDGALLSVLRLGHVIPVDVLARLEREVEPA